MRFVLCGGSPEEEAVLKKLAGTLGVEFATAEGEEPVLRIEFLPRETNPLEARQRSTQWLDEAPPPGRAEGVQNPLPGLDTPPCR